MSAWIVKRGSGRAVEYVYTVLPSGRVIFGLPDERKRFQCLASARATAKAVGGRVVRLRRLSACRVYREPCPDHGFIHGAEAEELREGIEKMIKDPPSSDHPESQMLVESLVDALQDMLDKVDARDSVAYREATRPRTNAARTTK